MEFCVEIVIAMIESGLKRPREKRSESLGLMVFYK